MTWECQTCMAPARVHPHEPARPTCDCGAPVVQDLTKRLDEVRDALSEYTSPWGWQHYVSMPATAIGAESKPVRALVQIYANRTGCRTFIAAWDCDFENQEWARILKNQVDEWVPKLEETLQYANNPALGDALFRDGKQVDRMGELYAGWET